MRRTMLFDFKLYQMSFILVCFVDGIFLDIADVLCPTVQTTDVSHGPAEHESKWKPYIGFRDSDQTGVRPMNMSESSGNVSNCGCIADCVCGGLAWSQQIRPICSAEKEASKGGQWRSSLQTATDFY